ncbi:RNA polymerase sigma factor [Mangrovivirga cuniculi]|uniref:RNA polymerase n=1 Tax=Mangrovivirga cuniculi TaxID=2715131 RepID=A0A4D7JLI3_9BACT|nr:sigma-70 family RNA polymerase sigma factor [Mangrovivirga cuniculi]QCK15753.1 RNA polymerase [Mangrovivirga cuniculi]
MSFELTDLITYTNKLIDEKSEEVIINEAKKNPQKFEPIYKKYYKPLFRMVISKTRDPDITADILSGVFCKALHKLPSFECRGKSIYFWLYRIAVNECMQYFRKTGKVRHVEIENASGLFDEISVFSDEQNIRLKKSLEKLSEKELQIIELRFFDGLKFQEIAEVISKNEGSCKMRLYRALEKLKKLMGS